MFCYGVKGVTVAKIVIDYIYANAQDRNSYVLKGLFVLDFLVMFVLAFLKNHFVKNDFSAENKTAILISF
jgi:uncharacterized sodium:solute symporter family permease YidK